MRTIVASILLAVCVLAVVIWSRPPQQWAEVVGDGVIRTNASKSVVASARESVIRAHQNWVENADGTKSDPSFQSGARMWKAGPAPDDVRVEVKRGRTQIVDEKSVAITIEEVSATDAPTLVFFQVDDSGVQQAVLNEFCRELRSAGVAMR